MNLYAMLQAREAAGRPIRVGLVGAGKFGTMFLNQLRWTPGMQLVGIADLSIDRVRSALDATGWGADSLVTPKEAQAGAARGIVFTEDAGSLIAEHRLDVVMEVTGHPGAGIAHALIAAENGCHIVMVNVEADVLAGPYLAEVFRRQGLVYSMAYGDQPALVCEMVDWAQACGFGIVAAGKGTKYLPDYVYSTPDTVWDHYGLSAEAAAAGGMNAQMFNSFLDGTKSAIEMAAIADATGLAVPHDGLVFPPAGAGDLAEVLKPQSAGGTLAREGSVEVVSSLHRDGRPIADDIRWGVYVTFRSVDEGAGGAYARRCFGEYGVATDTSGQYAALYRPSHLIGMELGVSVASAALRGEPTGCARTFEGDVVSVAKTALKAGDSLDGEGGYTVRGHLMPAADSLAKGALPIGLAGGARLVRDVPKDAVVTREDVSLADTQALTIREALEAAVRDAG